MDIEEKRRKKAEYQRVWRASKKQSEQAIAPVIIKPTIAVNTDTEPLKYKPKKAKKIVYKFADSSSSSSSSSEEEVVYVKKIKDKSKKQIHYKQDTNNKEYRQNDSLDSTFINHHKKYYIKEQ